VCRIAHRTVVVCPPGLGDELQAMKAGLMEIADLFVVNKADRPGADETAASLADSGLGGALHRHRPVLKTVATTGEGVDEVVEELARQVAEAEVPSRGAGTDHRAARALIASHAAQLVAERISDSTASEI